MKNQQTQQANVATRNSRLKSKSKVPPKILLKVDTWQKQSHGLFDYQSPPQKILNEQLPILQSSRIFRNTEARKTSVRSINQDSKNLPDRVQIFHLEYEPSRKSYMLKNSLSTQLGEVILQQGQQSEKNIQKNKLFLSLRQNGPGHKLVIGDFIKLGRVQLVVLEISNSQKVQSLDYQQIYGTKQYIFHLKEELQGCCKVCLSDEATQKDPLVNPCNCKGSCGVIHLDCLVKWINNKVKKQIFGKVRTYNFQKFSCEICKAPFPSIIRLQCGDEIELLNFQRPTSPYILFEQCSQTEEKQAKTLHFLLPEQGNKVGIGRGQFCQLNISDISVSRNHASVFYENNHFHIFDQNSKFGTLIEVRHDVAVSQSLRLQHNGCSISFGQKEEKKQRAKSGKKSTSKNA